MLVSDIVHLLVPLSSKESLVELVHNMHFIEVVSFTRPYLVYLINWFQFSCGSFK